MADTCDPIRSDLQAGEIELANTEKFLDEGGDGHHPVINPKFRLLEKKVEGLRSSLRECEELLIPSMPVPVTLTLTSFECLDQSDEISVLGINTEDDEPYAVVFAVDLKATNLGVPFGATNSKMTTVGPLHDVSEDDVVAAPENVIWGLSGVPDTISSADNLIVIAVMLEQDNGSPDQARTILEAAAQEALVTNLPAFTSLQIPRQELVSRMIRAMAGVMGTATVGFPGPDDDIGIQELRFTQSELDHIYRSLGPIEKSLTFEGDDAKYVQRFKMFR